MTDRRFSAILFDCDGVLVDSEPITVGVLHAMLGEMGWDLPLEECIRRFVGKAFKDEAHVIHEHTGYLIDDEWIAGFRDRRDDALRARLHAVPGAVDAVREHGAQRGELAAGSRHELDTLGVQLVEQRPEVIGDVAVAVQQRAIHVRHDQADVARLVADGGPIVRGHGVVPLSRVRDVFCFSRPAGYLDRKSVV